MDLMPCSSPCVYQITRDNLGSAIQYASKNGVRYRYSYSPWGVRTHQVGGNTVFYQPSDDSPFGPFYRTYTGHEDLWMFGLLNANARLYSPYLGRFISPDPLLNSEGGPLDYNPYIYARNNPYKYIDRNGEIWWWAIFAAIGAGCNIWQNWDNIHSVWDGIFYAGAGALSGVIGGCAGAAAATYLGVGTTGFISGVTIGAVNGFVSSTSQGVMNAAISGNPYQFSWEDCLIQTASSAVIGGVIGGIDAHCHNRDFWKGTNNSSYSVPEMTPTKITGYDENGKLSPHKIGEIGELQAMDDLSALGEKVVGRHFAYRVEGVKGYGITDVVSIDKNGMIHIVEVKNGNNPKFTNFQIKAFEKIKSGAKIEFFGPKASKFNLPKAPQSSYNFEIKFYNQLTYPK